MTKQYHFIGIGGIGMSGLARMLMQQNQIVSGSDISTSYVTEYLIREGASVFLGHKTEQITPEMTVIYSTDIAHDNPELVQAKTLGCHVLHRSDLLKHLLEQKKSLLVTGTHGKTTTTALLAHVFCAAGVDPSFAVGGMMQNFDCNASHGSGEHFIAEADESDGTFLKYPYCAAILTNIDTDHLAYFGNWDALIDAFKVFIAKSTNPDLFFYCIDDPAIATLSIQGTSYGFSENAAVRAISSKKELFSAV